MQTNSAKQNDSNLSWNELYLIGEISAAEGLTLSLTLRK